MSLRVSICVALVSVLYVCTECIDLPNAFDNIAPYATITTSSTCSIGTDCASPCVYRDDLPDFEKPLLDKASGCSDVDEVIDQAGITKANGHVRYDTAEKDCLAVQKNLTTGNGYFTVSVWVKVTECLDCQLLSIQDKVIFKQDGAGELTLVNNGNPWPTNMDVTDWTLLVVRYNNNYGKRLDWFVNNTSYNTTTTMDTAGDIELTLGPDINLTSTLQKIQMADARWYPDALTDREVSSLFTTKFQVLPESSHCRCGPATPIVDALAPPVGYGWLCTDGYGLNLPRLNVSSHKPLFMLDNDLDTYWKAVDDVQTVTIKLEFKKSFQIKSFVLSGIEEPLFNGVAEVFVKLTSDLATHDITFKGPCSQEATGRVLADHYSGGNISFNFDEGVSTRTGYENLLANTVSFQLASCSTQPSFRISEIRVEARCNCYGNDGQCSVSNGDYMCSCSSTSNTTGDVCDSCMAEYYRSADDLSCPSACQCDMDGSTSNVCQQVNGQCPCKTNVDPTKGRQCNECKFNTADLGSSDADGCTACTCNPDGIQSCGTNTTCYCKNNVEEDSGNCVTCLSNHYGITRACGCVPCGCDNEGTEAAVVDTCHNETGQCQCKTRVQGRTCNECQDQFYGLSSQENGCSMCGCAFVGSVSAICTKTTGQCPCVMDTGKKQCIPEIYSMEPKYGPVAGGTIVRITGANLDSPQVYGAEVKFGGYEQHILNRSSSFILLNTSTALNASYMDVSITWWYGNTAASFIKEISGFQYRPNPSILSNLTTINSYASGGCNIRVHGSSMDASPHPVFLVHTGQEQTHKTECCSSDDAACSADQLECKTPAMKIYDEQTTLAYGFSFDNVDKYEENARQVFHVVMDPVIVGGHEEIFRNTFDKVFTIKGERLNSACQDSDVRIQLNSDETCRLLSRHDGSITCDLGESFPGKSRDVNITIHIGNYSKIWGKLQIQSFWATKEFLYIVIGVGVLMLLCIFACCILRCRRSGKTIGEDSDLTGYQPPTRKNNYTDMPLALVNLATVNPQALFCERLDKEIRNVIKSSLIDKSDVTPGTRCIKKGSDIRIIDGTLCKDSTREESLTIKTLVDRYPADGDLPSWLGDGLLESTKLRDFSHNNVLRMMGIAIDAKYVSVLYPHMEHRTLKYYLGKDETQAVPLATKLSFCEQIAEGMNYLSTNDITHKDLAARNCWISSQMTLKIADGSFSADLYPDEYMDRNGRLEPVRWRAPESLKQGFFDSRSAVWSYGVLMWEVFTNGYMPYFDIDDDKIVVDAVCYQDCKLGRPEGITDQINKVMEDCCATVGSDRPNFFVIANNIKHAMSSCDDIQEEDYLNMSPNVTHGNAVQEEDYMNTLPKVKRGIATQEEEYMNAQPGGNAHGQITGGDEMYVNEGELNTLKANRPPPRPSRRRR